MKTLVFTYFVFLFSLTEQYKVEVNNGTNNTDIEIENEEGTSDTKEVLLCPAQCLELEKSLQMKNKTADTKHKKKSSDKNETIIIETDRQVGSIKSIERKSDHYFINFTTWEVAKLIILKDDVFRYYIATEGVFKEYPDPKDKTHTAKIIIKSQFQFGNKSFEKSTFEQDADKYVISSDKLKIVFNKKLGTMKVLDGNNKVFFEEKEALKYSVLFPRSNQTLSQGNDEYFFGGGMQNGRFTHKGYAINIINDNAWVDNQVTSPNPFYWSSKGYGVLRNTWNKGRYDFTAETNHITSHDQSYFDAYFMVSITPEQILKDYFELTGAPLLMPSFGFYEAHLNQFNRDYWVESTADARNAILFEDGKYYKDVGKDIPQNTTAILQSLNGEKNNYQFSARAMIDRYRKHDIPIGYFLPNDGYGAGYGQTDTLDGDIANLKSLGDYARSFGIEVALWTESNLEPVNSSHPVKGDRDFKKEASVAGVVAIKTDVAWVGSGYSFGLDALEKATKMFVEATKYRKRPMSITVDGWAGTQRYAAIWSGDQYGGQSEYIRFHIPTYIGTGLSGQPNFGSDMDGIFGGNVKEINIRDFQWKAFTPIQLNMDGWGSKRKTPFDFDDETTDINRAYLKLKSMIIPYIYSLAFTAISGLPMLRAMFLEFPDFEPSYTKDSQYQYMWGPNVLVAPIYNDYQEGGVAIRHGVFLPDDNQVWVDLFTGQKYQGGKIYNNIKVPLWKSPVYIKDGAIIPMTKPNNNPKEIVRELRIYTIYPNGESRFSCYEDDEFSNEYLDGKYAKTSISVYSPKENSIGDLNVIINNLEGEYHNMTKNRITILQIKSPQPVTDVKMAINYENVKMRKAESKEQFDADVDVFYWDEKFLLNPYLKDTKAENIEQQFLLVKIRKVDVTKSTIQLKVADFANNDNITGYGHSIDIHLPLPNNLKVDDLNTTDNKITLNWTLNSEFDSYEIERDGTIFTGLYKNEFTFENFRPKTNHSFKIRSIKGLHYSNWTEGIFVSTKDDPYKKTVKIVNITSSLPDAKGHGIGSLVDNNPNTFWQTSWQQNNEDRKLILEIDLKGIYNISRVEYQPVRGVSHGTFLKIKYKTSIDRIIWTPQTELEWKQDPTYKYIDTYINFRYLEIIVEKSVCNYGSGRNLYFYISDE